MLRARSGDGFGCIQDDGVDVVTMGSARGRIGFYFGRVSQMRAVLQARSAGAALGAFLLNHYYVCVFWWFLEGNHVHTTSDGVDVVTGGSARSSIVCYFRMGFPIGSIVSGQVRGRPWVHFCWEVPFLINFCCFRG